MSSSTAPKQRQSDVRRRAVLPTTLQNLKLAAAQSEPTTQLAADDFLDKMEEELNRKVDADVDALVEGMAELVKVHQVRSTSLLVSALCPAGGWNG